ncbi:Transferase [Parasponia andersonii]|uniref:Transferase n=1 Tax=Parasponia andersonii TaxID=3476 RepID=A0A2P5D1V2_PARAD|nr:Transferase [Parasponia andersonii]
MAEKMKELVKIITRETIKPCSPTPSDLKSYRISFLDKLQPPVYINMVYFYPTNNHGTVTTTQQLKKSLSESLARFYPISGRIISNNTSTIECSDEGAEYVEAQFSGVDLSTFLGQPPADPAVLQQFFPAACDSAGAGTWPLLVVQATFFECGGFALGVCISHKLADATTMNIFMKSWAATSARSFGSAPKSIVDPVLDSASYFPARDDLFRFQVSAPKLKKAEVVQRRYVFDKPKLMDLKAKITGGGDGVQLPTRVEAVVALIAKSMMAASSRPDSSSRGGGGGVDIPPKKFVVFQAVNLRARAEPPFPENLVGNFVGFVNAESEEEVAVQHLVAEMRRGMRDFTEKKAERLRGDSAGEVIVEGLKEVGDLIGRDNTCGLFFTSWCNSNIYEEVDFGWGKPIWATTPVISDRLNCVTLMDTRDGGVEAWVSLSKEEMDSFERDPQLLAYASRNPSLLL